MIAAKLRIGSLRRRLLALSALWLGIALLAAWVVISALLEGFITARFKAELDAIADQIVAASFVASDGSISLDERPDDARMMRPLSGWYWQLVADGDIVAQAQSLLDGRLTPEASEAAANTGPDGAELLRLDRQYTIPGSDALLTLTMTAPRNEIDEASRAINRPLGISLAVIGLGLVGLITLQITAGLASLVRLSRDVAALREGKIDELPLPEDRELRPMAEEIRALSAHNAEQLTRTREQLGNLAHSLKTPLMALSNQIPANTDAQGLIARMDRQIGWHLKQARRATGLRPPRARTQLSVLIADIALVMLHRLQERSISLDVDISPELFIAVEEEDLQEIIGNLIENAAKFANSRIALTADIEAGSDGSSQIRITLSDDGPGMGSDDISQAMQRGMRLDERGEGTGLGLAIVADLVRLNHGHITMARSALLGGLETTLLLPQSAQRPPHTAPRSQ